MVSVADIWPASQPANQLASLHAGQMDSVQSPHELFQSSKIRREAGLSRETKGSSKGRSNGRSKGRSNGNSGQSNGRSNDHSLTAEYDAKKCEILAVAKRNDTDAKNASWAFMHTTSPLITWATWTF